MMDFQSVLPVSLKKNFLNSIKNLSLKIILRSQNLTKLVMCLALVYVTSVEAQTVVLPKIIYPIGAFVTQYFDTPQATKPVIISDIFARSGKIEWNTYGDVTPMFNDDTTLNFVRKSWGLNSWATELHPAVIRGTLPVGTWYQQQGVIAEGRCPIGFEYVWVGNRYQKDSILICYQPPPCETCEEGNPIQVSSGIKIQRELDYQGINGLKFEREYRGSKWSNNFSIIAIDSTSVSSKEERFKLLNKLPCIPGLVSNDGITKTSYCFTQVSPSFGRPSGTFATDLMVQRGQGQTIKFGTATDALPNADINDRAFKVADGTSATWKIYNAKDDSYEYFDASGSLLRIVKRNGEQQSFTYSDASTPTSIAPTSGLLIRISDGFGRQINLSYDSQSRLISMRNPEGAVTSYAYGESTEIIMPGKQSVGNLTSVTYPDGKKRLYWYNEQDKTSGSDFPAALTGITDENGNRFATFRYASNGKAISSEHANGVDKYSFEYFYDRTEVTDPLNSTQKYYFTRTPSGARFGGVVRSDQRQTTISIDSNGNVRYKTDFNGSNTFYTYDLSRNLETKRVEADARVTSTIWHPTFRIPVQINEPLRRTIYTYDANGNVLTKTEQATTDLDGNQGAAATVVGTPRVWAYTYNSVGQVLTATGPRMDVNDVTTYAYDNQGNLTSVTNPAGHVTTMSNYDAHGHVGTITDPNGVVTNLTYHVRGWLLSRAVTADGITETTSYTYDGVGQMTKVTLPDNSTVNYTYDDAHRLTRISDHLGNSINYTLDNMGNRIKEEVKDTTGALTRQVTRVYDALNRLKEVTGGAQ